MALNIKERNEGRRSTRQKILIVCEGEKTEPGYFNSFRVDKEVCDIRGIGANTLSLVNEAKKIKGNGNYGEVWCVFDHDSFPKKNIVAALKRAKTLGFKCAFSNESFELWFVLHFCYLDTQITRKDYCKRLSGFLNKEYKKNDPGIYEALLPFQGDAIKNSEKLYKNLTGDGTHPADARPSTSVHLLVKRLNFLAKKVGR
ncbi:RloB family protein [Burkholderia ubonensis]|uniref:RloB family protein n=1 Tax=Burkholderia ubonensis TaxID=101571 RepID=UPI0009B35327|nr:RloB family protein [Burkholderia ubonensis]